LCAGLQLVCKSTASARCIGSVLDCCLRVLGFLRSECRECSKRQYFLVYFTVSAGRKKSVNLEPCGEVLLAEGECRKQERETQQCVRRGAGAKVIS
jgi:hypothetical protein